MGVIEVVFFSVVFAVMIYFHCVCWKNCQLIKKVKHKRGSFVMNKKVNNNE